MKKVVSGPIGEFQGGACESLQRGSGGPRGGQDENQGLDCAMRKVVLGPRGEVRGGVVSAQSVGVEGREGEKTRIRALDVR